MTVFVRLHDVADRRTRLRVLDMEGVEVYSVDCLSFKRLPGSPFAYWVPTSLLGIFGSHPRLHGDTFQAWSTNPLNDDFRYGRLSWEVPPHTIGALWSPWAKGGAQSDFFSDIHTLIGWEGKRQRVRGFIGTRSRPMERLASGQHFGRIGLTWPRRTNGFSPRVMPAGVVFGDKGPAIFDAHDRPDDLLALLALLCSSTFKYLLRAQLARVELAQSFEVGLLQDSPIPELDEETQTLLVELVRSCWSAKYELDTATETSHSFVLPAVLAADSVGLSAAADVRAVGASQTIARFDAAQARIDQVCFRLYGIAEEDSVVVMSRQSSGRRAAANGDEVRSEGDTFLADIDVNELAVDLVSWCVGVGMGRFDVRLATGERERPEEPDPFDQLPACSPGMLTGEDGLPLDVPPPGYPVEVSPVLVDDRGHRLDIVERVRSVFEVVFGDEADEWWSDVGEALGAKGHEVGWWLSKEFFDHHLKTYSKSRRKAPIYWPLGTASGSYLVWLYAHWVSGDSLFQVLHDLVSPKLVLERRRLSELLQEAGPNPSAGQRSAINGQEKLVGELQEFMDELAAVAPLWHPDLNDGIVVVLAPLWRLFAHHKPWSKELRKHWDSLVAGDYDWAQLAMHLWPERVVSKCAEDRSLAIAHGLEDVFWVQDDENPDKWHPRQTPTVPVEQLIAARTDQATKAALGDAVQ